MLLFLTPVSNPHSPVCLSPKIHTFHSWGSKPDTTFLSHRPPSARWHSLGQGLALMWKAGRHGPGLRTIWLSQRLSLPSPGNVTLPEAGCVQVTLDRSQCFAMAGGDASQQTAQGSGVLHRVLALMFFCSVALVYSLVFFCASVVLGARQR